MAELSWLGQRPHVPQSLKYLLAGPLKKKKSLSVPGLQKAVRIPGFCVVEPRPPYIALSVGFFFIFFLEWLSKHLVLHLNFMLSHLCVFFLLFPLSGNHTRYSQFALMPIFPNLQASLPESLNYNLFLHPLLAIILSVLSHDIPVSYFALSLFMHMFYSPSKLSTPWRMHWLITKLAFWEPLFASHIRSLVFSKKKYTYDTYNWHLSHKSMIMGKKGKTAN